MQMGIGLKPVALHSAPLGPGLIPKGGGEKICATQNRRLKLHMRRSTPMGEKQSFVQPSRRRPICKPWNDVPREGLTIEDPLCSFVPRANG